MHEACWEDSDEEGQHARFDGGEKGDINGLHAECQLKDERNIRGDWIEELVNDTGVA